MYTVELAERVYVLDCFKKKAKKRIATPKRDLDRIEQRLLMPGYSVEIRVRKAGKSHLNSP
jgi:hypothetical protein